MTQVGITSLPAEEIRGIGTDGANAIDGYGTHVHTSVMKR